MFRADVLEARRLQLPRTREGREQEDSPFRRVNRRWLLALLARMIDLQAAKT
jgi:hypothetical protein